MNASYAVPDTRFEQTFRRALAREAERERASQWKKMGIVDPVVISQLQKVQPPKISKLVVCKVVVRDVILMPLVQGLLWTSILIFMKPWLRQVVYQGRRLGSSIYKLVLGTDLVKAKKRI
ncbi:hypothetical protein HG536_0C04430 [Torulaspora globosa]|uniref:Transmembrane protein n=1 Tax=Torulaspora globosa TaxID=48254 RepID=A0A7G3ZFI8_9SACH|nr:uncharacterized protein HG536_0C04430 [Torulaspora globosa]QLL32274.1 hypothetical protein HG536_0C04430 [Torulaspora globosa]